MGARRVRLNAMRRFAALAAISFALCGCFNIGVVTGSEIPVDRVANIVPGVTTKDEILRWFGAPSEGTDGEVLARLGAALGLPGFDGPHDVRAVSKALSESVPAFANVSLDSVGDDGALLS